MKRGAAETMDKWKQYILSVLAVVIMLAGVGIYLYSNADKKEEIYSISVIVDDINPERWKALRQGIDLAAKDHRVEISFVTIGHRKSANEQNEAIDKELENGADAMLLDLTDSSYMKGKVERTALQIPVLLLETPVDSEELVPLMAPDFHKIGATLAKEVCEVKKFEKIGIVIGNANKLCNQECLEGVLENIEQKQGVQISWQIKEDGDLVKQIGEQVTETPVDCVITLENAATEAMIDYNLKSGKAIPILGVGNTEKAVYYLDKQMIRMLLVPDEYTMGYMSVDELSRKLKFGTALQDREIHYNVVTKENLYHEENQKMLFPIVQ